MQFSGTVYGGIEDATDETAGLALVLSANNYCMAVRLTVGYRTVGQSSIENYKLAVEESDSMPLVFGVILSSTASE